MSLTTNTSSSISRSGTTKRSPAAGAHSTPALRSRPACSIVITLPSSPRHANCAGSRRAARGRRSAAERVAQLLGTVCDPVPALGRERQIEQCGRLEVAQSELRAEPSYGGFAVGGRPQYL